MCEMLPPPSEEFIRLMRKMDHQLSESLIKSMDAEILNSVKESPTLDGQKKRQLER